MRAFLLFAFVSSSLVLGLAQNSRNADYLRGEGDISSCTLQEALNRARRCGQTAAQRRELSTRQTSDIEATPNECTCNNIYFNVWSACALTSGSRQLPSLTDWRGICQDADVPFNHALRTPRIDTVAIPAWAQLPAVGDTFDIMRAVVVAHGSTWRPIHIIAPVASAVGTMVILGLMLLLVGRKRACFRRVKAAFHPSLQPVRYEKAKEDWTIDRNEEVPTFIGPRPSVTDISNLSVVDQSYVFGRQNSVQQPVHLQPAVPVDRKPSPRPLPTALPNANQSSVVDLNAIDSSRSQLAPLPLYLTSDDGASRLTPPLQSKWSESEHQASLEALPITATHTSKRMPGSATLHSVVNHLKGVPSAIPNPFRARPTRLKHVLPKPGFRLDDYDAASEAGRRATQDSALDMAADRDPASEERETLISEDDRHHNRVFLISKVPGENFTIGSKTESRQSHGNVTVSNVNSSTVNSNIQVVTPTTESSSAAPWKSFWNKRRSDSKDIPAVVPPAPQHPPPPAPTASSFKTPTPSFPLREIPDESTSTLQRYDFASTMPRQPPATELNTNGDSSSINGPMLLQPPFRSNVYDPERYPTPPSIAKKPSNESSVSGHYRLNSDSSISLLNLMDVDAGANLASAIPPPRPTAFVANGYHHTRGATRPKQPHQPQPQPHRRGLSDDDTASFYLTPNSPPTHVRNLSQENLHPDRSNPELLFPSSVRAVGYSGGASSLRSGQR
ncbi:hypothetical protein CC2G_009652 [Coprinopsis cinerea AmutBmut pab1-1]|nr:hypothetical protein CC2G_009652 [Coprinopsis cinerea AmutBmut pab1-1]